MVELTSDLKLKLKGGLHKTYRVGRHSQGRYKLKRRKHATNHSKSSLQGNKP